MYVNPRAFHECVDIWDLEVGNKIERRVRSFDDPYGVIPKGTLSPPNMFGLCEGSVFVAGVAMAAPTDNRLLTAKGKLPRCFKCPRSGSHEVARRGDLPCVELGRYRRFRGDEVIRWVESKSTKRQRL